VLAEVEVAGEGKPDQNSMITLVAGVVIVFQGSAMFV